MLGYRGARDGERTRTLHRCALDVAAPLILIQTRRSSIDKCAGGTPAPPPHFVRSVLAAVLSIATVVCIIVGAVIGLVIAVLIHTAALPLYRDLTAYDGQRYVTDTTAAHTPSTTMTGQWAAQYNPRLLNPSGKALDGRRFTVVSAASNFYFDRLANLVGSLHHWEPTQDIVVYDLGLSNHQRAAVRCWQRVTLVPFPFHLFPQHVRNVFNYSFKLLLIQLALHQYHRNASTSGYIPLNEHEDVGAYEDHSVLFLDAGLEVRSPFAIDEIAAYVHPDLAGPGHWQAQQPNTVDAKTSPMTLEKLGVTVAEVAGKPFCAAGMHAWRLHSRAYSEVIVPAVKCALEEDCIAPWSTGQNNHRWEQSIMSALVYHTNRGCEPDRSWREWDMSQLTESTTRFNHVQLVTRRWHSDKPYIAHIDVDAHANVTADSSKIVCSRLSQVIESDDENLLLPFASDAVPPVAAIDAATNDDGIESIVLSHIDAVKLNSEDPLRHCLKVNDNSRRRCITHVRRHLETMFELRNTVQRSALISTAATPTESAILCGFKLVANILTSWRTFVSFIDIWGFRLAHRLRVFGPYVVLSTVIVYTTALATLVRYCSLLSSATEKDQSYSPLPTADKIDDVIDTFSLSNSAYPYQSLALRSEYFITRLFDSSIACFCSPRFLALLATNTNFSPARRIFSSAVRLSILILIVGALPIVPLIVLHVVLAIIAI